MARYIVNNSKFTPFTFDEMLKPLAIYGQEYRAQEEALAELSTKANVWEEMANEQTDPYAYKMYKTYANDLENQVGQLAREGLTPISRQNMLKMRQRYSSDIVPIEQAYKRRQELIDEQRKLLAQDNTLMFDRNASMLSLDDLIKNPQLTYQSYSGATLAKQVGAAVKNLSKEIRENPRKWKDILGGQYYETIIQKGYRPEEIIQVLQNDPNASSILTGIVQDVIDSSNIASWKDQVTLDRAYDYARQGLWDAIGDTQYQTLSNKVGGNDNPKNGDKDDGSGLYYRAVPKTTVDGDKKTSQMNDDLKVLREILANPALINKTATRTVRKSVPIMPDPATSIVIDMGTGATREETYYPYRDKLNELSKRYVELNYTFTDGKLSENNFEELAQRIENDIASSAVREFTYKPNITESNLIVKVLKENSRSNNERTGHTGLWELNDNKKGKEIDIKDFTKYFTSDSDIDFYPDLGFIINSTDDKGVTRSALLDTELFDDSDRTFRKAQESIKVALDNGEDELATLFIRATMKAFYDKFNTLEKRQGNTF